MGKRGGFPGGFGGMGGMNINNLMKEAKKMQADLEKSQEAGGGAVKAIVTGAKVLKELTIKPEVLDPDDVEMLQDLIITCVNEAMRKVDEEQSASMGKFNIPGLM